MRHLMLIPLLVACGGEPASTPAAPAAAPVAPAPAAKAAPEAPPAAPADAADAAPADAAAADATADAGAGGDHAEGKKIYDTYCVACHQADGTGMNGMLAGNFVADKERLAKPDEELLASIRDGVTGKIGAMPPWGSQLSEEQMVAVLAYIRATYGG